MADAEALFWVGLFLFWFNGLFGQSGGKRGFGAAPAVSGYIGPESGD
ncbi:MAG: hypothetical protein Q8K85_17310 [Hyphomicrobium sp.]|nr:hypothetical protein [Hyphomicrobium sp.]